MTDDSDDDVSDLDLSSGNKDSFVIEVSFFVLHVLLLKDIMITFSVSFPCLSNTWSFFSFFFFLGKIIMVKLDVLLPVLIAVKQQLTVNSSMVKPDKFRKSDCVGMCI